MALRNLAIARKESILHSLRLFTTPSIIAPIVVVYAVPPATCFANTPFGDLSEFHTLGRARENGFLCIGVTLRAGDAKFGQVLSALSKIGNIGVFWKLRYIPPHNTEIATLFNSGKFSL
ncbi:hypothetical protein HJFPF1_10652 [Paramyrothecium foliicola]|nr:hypothetical protein HJFPF1_10652 [Paramyrothecium foliicola]